MSIQKWGIDDPREAAKLSPVRLAEEFKAAIDHGVFSPLARAVFLETRKRLAVAEAVMDGYMNWFEDSPEDSWRLQRDMCAALHLPEDDDEADA